MSTIFTWSMFVVAMVAAIAVMGVSRDFLEMIIKEEQELKDYDQEENETGNPPAKEDN